MVVALLGVLKAGGAYVPLDAVIPGAAARLHDGRLRGEGADNGQNLLGRVSGYGGGEVAVDRDRELISQQSRTNPGVGD